jgi:DnaJ family protein C protein 7
LESCEKFEEALAFCPPDKVEDKVKLCSNLSICMMKLEQYETAVGYCNDALELDETWSKARYNRAECCFKLQRYDKALEDLKQVFTERPDLRNDKMMNVIFGFSNCLGLSKSL